MVRHGIEKTARFCRNFERWGRDKEIHVPDAISSSSKNEKVIKE